MVMEQMASNRILAMGKTGLNQMTMHNAVPKNQSVSKRSRRLRKNFDLLSQALKQQSEKHRSVLSENSRNAYVTQNVASNTFEGRNNSIGTGGIYGPGVLAIGQPS